MPRSSATTTSTLPSSPTDRTRGAPPCGPPWAERIAGRARVNPQSMNTNSHCRRGRGARHPVELWSLGTRRSRSTSLARSLDLPGQEERLALLPGQELGGGLVPLHALGRGIERQARPQRQRLAREVDAVRVEVREQELAGRRERARARDLREELLPRERASEALGSVREVNERARAHADLNS